MEVLTFALKGLWNHYTRSGTVLYLSEAIHRSHYHRQIETN